jgi:ionotropic glutamate receptor NMDA 2B
MFLIIWLGRFKILGTILVNNNASNLGSLLGTEARILLLYSTREEARSILKTAGQMGLTGDKYVWIVTQSVIGSTTESPPKFPVGMLGKIFVVYFFYLFRPATSSPLSPERDQKSPH